LPQKASIQVEDKNGKHCVNTFQYVVQWHRYNSQQVDKLHIFQAHPQDGRTAGWQIVEQDQNTHNKHQQPKRMQKDMDHQRTLRALALPIEFTVGT
jgi:hypothetical protein